jgi:RNA polymerase sigma-70 factor (ECF subfamily)
LDEAWVISQVRTGKTDLFGEVVEEYQAPIFRHLLRMTGNHEVARDLTQDTFLKAYQSILKTDSELSLKAWLYRIATNNALKYHRRRRLLTFVPFRGTEKLPATDATPNTDEKIAIEEALLQVPPERRVCLALHFVEGLRYREIAEIIGIKEDTVRKRVAKGRVEFRRAYESKTGGDIK